jgi:hypothetical protein
MVVDYFHPLRVAILPQEADPILIVDPDAVLPATTARQRLEAVARERSQVVEPPRRVELHEPALSDPGNAPKPACGVPLEERLGVSIPERPDHLLMVLRVP